MFLEQEFARLKDHFSESQSINPRISQVSVGWHLDHSLLTIAAIIDRLASSDPQKYRSKFNLPWSYIRLIGRIPRGKGKSPPAVIPQGEITETQLRQRLQHCRRQITVLANLDPSCYFLHPYFGCLNVKNAKTFMKIHTRHHQDIITDILKQKNKLTTAGTAR